MDQERRIISWSVLDEWPLSISACFDMRLQITFNRVARIFASLAVRLLRRLPRLADFDHSNATSAFLLVRFSPPFVRMDGNRYLNKSVKQGEWNARKANGGEGVTSLRGRRTAIPSSNSNICHRRRQPMKAR